MSPKKISRPIGNDAEELEHPIITGFTPIASYNWLDDPDPTTLVTGCPPKWSPPSIPQPLTPDTGFRYIDQNADRYPQSPLTPLFSSILQVHGTYPFQTIDIISDRSPLRKLYAFAANEPNLQDFRFGVSTFGSSGKKKTVVFHRMEERTRDMYEGVKFHGYRAGFEGQYLRLDENVGGNRSHYRISTYELGGLQFLVRSAVDGYILSGTNASTPSVEKNIAKIVEDQGSQEDTSRNVIKKYGERTADLAKGKKKEKTHQAGNSSSPTPSAVSHTSSKEERCLKVLSSNNISITPHNTHLELITRSKTSRTPFDIATKMPDLYLSQTMNFVEAYHRNVGHHKRKSEGIFMLEDVKVRDMSEELMKWEKDMGVVLGRYLKVVGEILGIVREEEGEGCWEVSHAAGGGGGLEVKEVEDGFLLGMKQELGRFFS